METADQAEDPEPAGPWFSNIGPRDGLIMAGEAPVMGVLPCPDGNCWPCGIAWHAGSIPSRRGPVQVWRLTVRNPGALKGPERELQGRWVCRNRRFERLGDATEEL